MVRAPRRLALRRLAALLLLTACASPAAVEPQGLPSGAQRAAVVRHVDGDTLWLRGLGGGPVPPTATKVRVLLVDTPEVRPQECGGAEAKRRTAQLVPAGSEVRVERDADPRDRYDRLLLHVYLPDGRSMGEVLVAEGHATVLQVAPNRRHLERFERAESDAREAGRGLWSACR